MNEKVLILDFGSQFTQLIARRVRELGIYSEVIPYYDFEKHIEGSKAVILSGSPSSVRSPDAPKIDLARIVNVKPILGICYGAQLITQELGGSVSISDHREYGRASLIHQIESHELLGGVEAGSQVWMSHADSIDILAPHFEVIASTEGIPYAAFKAKDGAYSQAIFGLQFHPEVSHTVEGERILSNFLLNIAGCEKNWTPQNFVSSTMNEIKKKVGDDEVLLGLSGGVDSTVVASLLHKAIGAKLKPFFVNNGLLRKNEFEEVLASYKEMGLNVTGVDASERFLNELHGVCDPEKKRKIIGRVFIEVFQEYAAKMPKVKWLAQGTIYPDVIESVSVHGPSVTIKSHHNVGGLPEKLDLKLLEPMRMLFKDEVRKVGAALHIPEEILNRHPFPGPGLAIRILGEISKERVELLQHADHIYIKNLKQSGWYDKIWQAGTILLNSKSVGVMGDERTYEFTVALRAVHSLDGMTADWVHIPYDLLGKISNDIINNVKGINRVVYDISSKPPATIEWE